MKISEDGKISYSDQSCKGQPEAEFMNVQLLRFLFITLRNLRFEVSLYKKYIANQFQTIFARGGGGGGGGGCKIRQ